MISNNQMNATISVTRTPQGAGKTRNELGEVIVDFEPVFTCRAFVDRLSDQDVFALTGGLVKTVYRIFINYWQYKVNPSGPGKVRFAADIQQDDRIVITQLTHGNQVDVGRKLRVQYSSVPGNFADDVEIVAYYETGGN